MTEIRGFGTWRSPLSAEKVAEAGVRLDSLCADGEALYWLEARPAEAGRHVIVRFAGGREEDLIPAPYSARSFVHEYGGGSFTVRNQALLFTNAADMAIYHCAPGSAPENLLALPNVRFADFDLHPQGEAVLAVAEDHNQAPPENRVEWISISGEHHVLARGHDFYAAPRWDRTGKRVAWLSWDQPNMPWDGTELWVADVTADGSVDNARKVAGGATESVQQPLWGSDGELLFISDRSGWWNLYRWNGIEISSLAPMESECGTPMWSLGNATYAQTADGDIVFAAADEAHPLWCARKDGTVEPLPAPFSEISEVASFPQAIAVIGGGPRISRSVALLQSSNNRTLKSSGVISLGADNISAAEAMSFPGYQGKTAHALAYWPKNADYRGPDGELPPLVVYAHGGPTSANSAVFSPAVQYWTTRGFAYCAVDYAGSSGYGRAYRERLNGTWGIADIEDCLAAARHLADVGKVDPRRLLIRGGSAGGWVVLCAMASHDLFAAGASLFGVADLELLAKETHKFEARYFDLLVAPYPENAELFRQRSPLARADHIRKPLILLQGLEDVIVPPNQSEMIFETVRRNGIPCAYVAYAGEQHGFRRSENIAHSLRAELTFYARVLGFEADDMLPDFKIENLPPAGG